MNKNAELTILSMNYASDDLIVKLSDGREIGIALSKIPWFQSANDYQKTKYDVIKNSRIVWTELNQRIEFDKFNKFGKCKLCLKPKLLQKESHIIPKFIFKQSKIMDEDGKINEVVLNTSEMQIKSHTERPGSGFVVNDILCENCDKEIIGKKYEDYVAKIIYTNPSVRIAPVNKKVFYENMNNSKADEFENVDKGKFKLFLLSILWRCSVTKHDAFKNVKLGTYEERIREMVYKEDAGSPSEFPFAIFTTLKNINWTEDIVAIPIRDKFNGGSYYKVLLGGFIFISNISLNAINDFFQSDESKIIAYHLPDHLTLTDFGNKKFLHRVFSHFAGKVAQY